MAQTPKKLVFPRTPATPSKKPKPIIGTEQTLLPEFALYSGDHLLVDFVSAIVPSEYAQG